MQIRNNNVSLYTIGGLRMSVLRQNNIKIDEDVYVVLERVARPLGISVPEFIRRCLPSAAVAEQYLQIREHVPGLDYRAVFIGGTRARLNSIFEAESREHAARLGLDYDTASNQDYVDARTRILAELQVDTEHPLDPRCIERAEKDLWYAGRLHDALWKAKSGTVGYRLVKASWDLTRRMPGSKPRREQKYWVVLLDGVVL